jgi:hypothetical protein
MAVFGKDYLQAPTEQDTTIILRKMQVEDFLGCLGASIACIEVGRTARLLGKDCTKDTVECAVSYFKRWQIRISGFGMHSSEWREL